MKMAPRHKNKEEEDEEEGFESTKNTKCQTT